MRAATMVRCPFQGNEFVKIASVLRHADTNYLFAPV